MSRRFSLGSIFFLVASLPSLIPAFVILFIPAPLKDVKLKVVFNLLIGLIRDSLRIAMKFTFNLSLWVFYDTGSLP